MERSTNSANTELKLNMEDLITKLQEDNQRINTTLQNLGIINHQIQNKENLEENENVTNNILTPNIIEEEKINENYLITTERYSQMEETRIPFNTNRVGRDQDNQIFVEEVRKLKSCIHELQRKHMQIMMQAYNARMQRLRRTFYIDSPPDQSISTLMFEIAFEYITEYLYTTTPNCIQNESICLFNYKEEEKLCLLPCFHSFHKDCITLWIHQKLVCPICKTQII